MTSCMPVPRRQRPGIGIGSVAAIAAVVAAALTWWCPSTVDALTYAPSMCGDGASSCYGSYAPTSCDSSSHSLFYGSDGFIIYNSCPGSAVLEVAAWSSAGDSLQVCGDSSSSSCSSARTTCSEYPYIIKTAAYQATIYFRCANHFTTCHYNFGYWQKCVDWVTGSWSTCTGAYGTCSQTRNVYCADHTNNAITYPDSYCYYTKPGDTQSCTCPSAPPSGGSGGSGSGSVSVTWAGRYSVVSGSCNCDCCLTGYVDVVQSGHTVSFTAPTTCGANFYSSTYYSSDPTSSSVLTFTISGIGTYSATRTASGITVIGQSPGTCGGEATYVGSAGGGGGGYTGGYNPLPAVAFAGSSGSKPPVGIIAGSVVGGVVVVACVACAVAHVVKRKNLRVTVAANSSYDATGTITVVKV